MLYRGYRPDSFKHFLPHVKMWTACVWSDFHNSFSLNLCQNKPPILFTELQGENSALQLSYDAAALTDKRAVPFGKSLPLD